MILEKVYLSSILLFFILAFAIKNVSTYLATKKSIRGQSPKLTASISLSTAIYILILMRITFLNPAYLLEGDFSQYQLIKIVGFALLTIGFIMGLLSLLTMRTSWRVGIKHDQKTALITSGIYRLSRNPYFFSYDILILGYILIYPSLILLLLYIPLVIIFHKMILEEEQYLLVVHNQDYDSYKKKVGRYFTFK